MLQGIEKRTGEEVGVGLDSCVLPTRHKGISLVQTTDFFYPLVEDPYMQVVIRCIVRIQSFTVARYRE